MEYQKSRIFDCFSFRLVTDIIKPKEAAYAAGKHGGFFVGLKKEMLKRADKFLKGKK